MAGLLPAKACRILPKNAEFLTTPTERCLDNNSKANASLRWPHQFSASVNQVEINYWAKIAVDDHADIAVILPLSSFLPNMVLPLSLLTPKWPHHRRRMRRMRGSLCNWPRTIPRTPRLSAPRTSAQTPPAFGSALQGRWRHTPSLPARLWPCPTLQPARPHSTTSQIARTGLVGQRRGILNESTMAAWPRRKRLHTKTPWCPPQCSRSASGAVEAPAPRAARAGSLRARSKGRP